MTPEPDTDSNLVKHAWAELQTAGMFDADSDYGGMVGDAVLDLVKKFAEQGHSGFSAGMTTHLFHELVQFKPLGPLTDRTSEWNVVALYDTYEMSQSRRQSDAFSEDGGKTYYALSEQRKWMPRWFVGLFPERWYRRLMYPHHPSKQVGFIVGVAE